MSTSGCHTTVNFLIFLCLAINSAYSWDSDDLELFDLVEEVNANFYELLGVSTTASGSEIKKAYRKKTLQVHPDKNEAADAEEQFRKLVSVYEVLKDDEKREKYNQVLETGLPDWRQPVFYYRKARKLGLVELAAVLFLIITVGHYFVMWAIYLERRLALEDFFESKRKRETKGKRGKAAVMNEKLEENMNITLQSIPKPQLAKLWPITFTLWSIRTSVGFPSRVRMWREMRKLEMEARQMELEEQERLDAQYREEQELRKQKRKVKVEREIAVLTKSDITPVMYGQKDEADDSSDSGSVYKENVKTGEWVDEDYVLLSKAYIKFPGGTAKRWEKIAEMVGRPVNEVTSKYKKMKGNFQMNLSDTVQGGIKAKKDVVISDDIISKPTDETENSENVVRKRHKNKQKNDTEKTLITSNGSGNDQSNKENITSNQASSMDSNSKQNSLQKQQKNQSSAKNTSSVKISEKKSDNKNTEGALNDKSESNNDPQVKCEGLDAWSQNQQVILEWALKQYPKGTDQRWEKIAEQIPGKTKEECVLRFKYLAVLVKQKKQQKS
ncbi:uncharacterized protein F54F2.9-like isoform X1 [Mya arenaria]|uniref:uncharacterized protein F54F2.9-like isoform X1 n=1 Tax=Mya arenaria TaxID=6604 RepID=UPI0022E52927|nr:uncharacterized protein F54F2.9-like isoform X1 [Mya arenaria]